MSHGFGAVKVTENVYWVGAIDWNVRNMHGYLTSRGTTYNAYLILADKITLIDTVKAQFRDEMMSRIKSLIDPQTIDYIVSNHSEMDHTGCLPDVMEMVQPEKTFASAEGVKALDAHFQIGDKITKVGDGEEIDLGNMKLLALWTKLLHWPDSMMTYLREDKILFSQDGFGMHLASNERFDDELAIGVLDEEASKYFANILIPFAGNLKRAVTAVSEAGLEFDFIAPDHGPVWRENQQWIIEKYVEWANQDFSSQAVIIYDTMWGSTAKMAKAIGDGMNEAGMHVAMMPLSACHRSDIVTKILTAGALVVGSPTINNQLFPTIADCMCYVRGLRPKNLVGAVFGSYGWGAVAVKQLEGILDEMKVERVAESIKVNYVPTEEDLIRCHEMGEKIAAEALSRIPA